MTAAERKRKQRAKEKAKRLEVEVIDKFPLVTPTGNEPTRTPAARQRAYRQRLKEETGNVPKRKAPTEKQKKENVRR